MISREAVQAQVVYGKREREGLDNELYRASKRGRRGNRHSAIHPVSLWLDGALDGSLHSAGEAAIEGRHGISDRRGWKGKVGN